MQKLRVGKRRITTNMKTNTKVVILQTHEAICEDKHSGNLHTAKRHRWLFIFHFPQLENKKRWKTQVKAWAVGCSASSYTCPCVGRWRAEGEGQILEKER